MIYVCSYIIYDKQLIHVAKVLLFIEMITHKFIAFIHMYIYY